MPCVTCLDATSHTCAYACSYCLPLPLVRPDFKLTSTRQMDQPQAQSKQTAGQAPPSGLLSNPKNPAALPGESYEMAKAWPAGRRQNSRASSPCHSPQGGRSARGQGGPVEPRLKIRFDSAQSFGVKFRGTLGPGSTGALEFMKSEGNLRAMSEANPFS